MAYQKVLVGTDGSETATAAVRQAAELAAATGAQLIVASAYQSHPHDVAKAQAEAPEEIRWRITDAGLAEQHVTEAKQAALGAGAGDVDTRIELGEPADVIINLAEEVGADVIVVGSKGMSSPSRFLLGNVPNKVSHHAPCDVLIVHTV